MRRVCCTAHVPLPWRSSPRPSTVFCGDDYRDLLRRRCSSNHRPSTPSSSSLLPPSFPHLPTTLIRGLSPSRIYPCCRQCRTSRRSCRLGGLRSLLRRTAPPPTALLPGRQSSSLPFFCWGGGFWRIMNEQKVVSAA